MKPEHHRLESGLVRRVMPDATEEEIEKATQRWFSFLETLIEIVERKEQEMPEKPRVHGCQ